jgi:3D (Asp-Asp-Asp) domain-containing protein
MLLGVKAMIIHHLLVTPPQYVELGTFTVTAYTNGPESTGKTPSDPAYGKTASGVHTQAGVTIACPKRFPFGTKLYIESVGVRVCQDRGGAIKGNHIDLFIPELSAALKFGKRNLKVRKVLEDGKQTRRRTILWGTQGQNPESSSNSERRELQTSLQLHCPSLYDPQTQRRQETPAAVDKRSDSSRIQIHQRPSGTRPRNPLGNRQYCKSPDFNIRGKTDEYHFVPYVQQIRHSRDFWWANTLPN